MAIKFSAKHQPASPAAAKPAKPAAAPKVDKPSATDLFDATAQTPPRKTKGKK
ncbi:hypothetical protein [Mesorhizobium sp. M4A.F.Ca.ET.022.05.2.1]|uniref:hypothetical protein n=1 Tax=Mesorhizobium sp. M4A.F.Ca.ET.022.05.2.1 TaxID=2496653 RepID=UPI0016790710|nr:hypothetical protein [Mesorhizobium sp. M4A.F.Ca.ET.022.05.2.1]